MIVEPRSISGAITINGKLVGTAWRTGPDVALTAAHCLRVDPLSQDYHRQCTIEFPDGSTSAAVRDFDEKLDIAVLDLTQHGSSWIELATLPWEDPRLIGEIKLRWHGYGYPDAKTSGLELTGEISSVAEREGQGIQLSCDQGGYSNLKHASGSAIIHGNRAIGLLIWHPEALAGKVIYARPVDQIQRRFPFLLASPHPQLGVAGLAAQRGLHGNRDSRWGSALWQPISSEVFIGRNDELATLERTIAAKPTGRAARATVVGVQGMAGVGKSFLVDEFCARNAGQFDAMCRWVLDPTKPEPANAGLLELAQQVGIDRDRTPLETIPAALAGRNLLIHVDNVDSPEAGEVVVELLAKLSTLPAIVTGRYTSLGTSPTSNWIPVKVECLGVDQSIAMLRAELGEDAPAEDDLRELAMQVGGLPLALHLAAGYLRGGYSVTRFLARLQSANLGLKLIDPTDPLWRSRSQGMLSASFEISREIFNSTVRLEGYQWDAALSALGWATPIGFGPELGVAISGLTPELFQDFIHIATALSLTRRVPKSQRVGFAWSVHPLLAEFLRVEAQRDEVYERIGTWVKEFASEAPPANRADRWRILLQERAQVHRWLNEAAPQALTAILPHSLPFAISVGPARPWLESAQRALQQVGSDGSLEWVVTNIAWKSGNFQLAEQALARVPITEETKISIGLVRGELLKARGDRNAAAMLADAELIPNILKMAHGAGRARFLTVCAELIAGGGRAKEAVKLLEEEVLPYLQSPDNTRERTVAFSALASAYHHLGDFSRSISIRNVYVIPAHRTAMDLREVAINLENIAQAYLGLTDSTRAHEAFSEALPLHVELGDRAAAWRVAHELLTLNLSLGRYSEARQIALSYLIPFYMDRDPAQGVAAVAVKIAEAVHALPEVQRKSDIEVFLEIFSDPRISVMAHRILSQLALRLENSEKPRLALKVQSFAVERFTGETDVNTSTARARVADLLLVNGDYLAAERCYVSVLPMLRASGAGMGLVLALVRLASARCSLQDFGGALASLRSDYLPAWALLDQEQRKQIAPGISLGLENIAQYLIAQGRPSYAGNVIEQYLIPVLREVGPDGAKRLARARQQLRSLRSHR